MSYERRKIRVGRVVSDKMDQTVTVVFEWRRNHALYKKSVRRRTRFKAHDPSNECKIGDLVRIIEGRPYSKTKRWKVLDILEHEEIAELQPEEIVVEDPSVLTARAAQPEEAVAAPITVDEIADIGEDAEASAVEAEEDTATEEDTEPIAEAEAEEDTAAVDEPEAE
ncbi:MAG: 30S ribosomal protein S17, partial [Chloroflexi bacterium]|nr:30S ribosomal protein S17 [Chloroflexota bacterium]